jgi:SWI/SNF-related matrix-associated actin-dependent regulator of chromatin subfamily A3
VLIATSSQGESFGFIVPYAGLIMVDLMLEDQCFFLHSRSSERLAVLNEATSKVLRDILALQGCYYKTYVAKENLDDFLNIREKTDKKLYSVIDIVLYGPPEARDTIGKLLSTARTYLQHPCYQEANTSYENPHVLKLTDSIPVSQSLQTSTPPVVESQVDAVMVDSADIQVEGDSPQSQVRRKVATVFDSLTRSQNLKRIEADIRIKTLLLQ